MYNLESFGIVPENFAHEVSVGVACSTSVTQADNKTLGKQVMIQGNQVHFVGQLLLGMVLISACFFFIYECRYL